MDASIRALAEKIDFADLVSGGLRLCRAPLDRSCPADENDGTSSEDMI